jgi:hypothetical protein
MYPISGGGEDESSLLHINMSMNSAKDTTSTHNTAKFLYIINIDSLGPVMNHYKTKKTVGKELLSVNNASMVRILLG